MRLLITLAAVALVQAQLEHSYERFAPRTMRVASPVINLPKQNNRGLSRSEVQVGKMYTFGTQVPMVTSLSDGQWTKVRDGRVWSLTFASEDAFSLNLKFNRFRIPEGAAMWIYGNGMEVQGAYTEANNYASGEFMNWPVDGDRITVEYFQPDDVYGEPVLDISEVIHGYKDHKNFACGSSGSCNVNSACDDQWGGLHSNQIRGGAMVLNGGGSGYCSGSMINTIGNTGRQLFLTAAHCGTAHAGIKFHFASATCTPTNCPAGNNVGNINILLRRTESDFTIAEVGERIPESWNVFLSGFSASSVPTNFMSGVHHPSADVQKMAYAYKTAQYDRWSGSGPSTHWRVTSWDNRTTTEGGSSGSPLFDAQQRIIGQLHGGTASCNNPNGYDTYGGIYYSWDDGLSQYLNPFGQDTDFVDGVDLNAVRGNYVQAN